MRLTARRILRLLFLRLLETSRRLTEAADSGRAAVLESLSCSLRGKWVSRSITACVVGSQFVAAAVPQFDALGKRSQRKCHFKTAPRLWQGMGRPENRGWSERNVFGRRDGVAVGRLRRFRERRLEAVGLGQLQRVDQGWNVDWLVAAGVLPLLAVAVVVAPRRDGDAAELAFAVFGLVEPNGDADAAVERPGLLLGRPLGRGVVKELGHAVPPVAGCRTEQVLRTPVCQRSEVTVKRTMRIRRARQKVAVPSERRTDRPATTPTDRAGVPLYRCGIAKRRVRRAPWVGAQCLAA